MLTRIFFLRLTSPIGRSDSAIVQLNLFCVLGSQSDRTIAFLNPGIAKGEFDAIKSLSKLQRSMRDGV
jgi:hypothetical protein